MGDREAETEVGGCGKRVVWRGERSKKVGILKRPSEANDFVFDFGSLSQRAMAWPLRKQILVLGRPAASWLRPSWPYTCCVD